MTIVENGVVLAEEQFPHGLQHAARILPVIDSLCKSRGWKPADLKELYISVGPGSFTGLRIGVTTAKTMALATGVKLVAVPSVLVLVQNAPQEARNVIIVLDAKRGQIFTARFQRTSDRWIEMEAAHLDTLAAMIERSPKPVHLLGEGMPYHQDELAGNDSSLIQTPPEAWHAQAKHVARLGWELARRGEFVDPMKLLPLYVRVPEAQEKFDAANPR